MKNKKLLLVGLTSVMAIGLAGAISTKGSGVFSKVSAGECIHEHVEHYDAVEATTTATGKVEHWACCDCGSVWINTGKNDGTLITEDNRSKLIIPTVNYSELSADDVAGLGIADSPANKNKGCDQSLTVSGTDSNDASWTSYNQYVQIDGKKAFRISTFDKAEMRAAQSTYNWGNAGFRFTPSGLSNIDSISFDYKYDERGDLSAKVDSIAHEIVKLKGASSNGNTSVGLELVADNAWHTKTIEFDSLSSPTQLEFVIHAMFGQIFISNLVYNEHVCSYDYNGECSCGATLATEFDLTPCSSSPITLTDLGMSNPTNIKDLGGSHLFYNYDFDGNKGIDLRFNFSYTITDGTPDASGSYMYFYLGNSGDENGVVFRLCTDRADQYVSGEIYHASSCPIEIYDKSNNKLTPGSSQHMNFKPGVQPNGGSRLFRVSMELTDSTTNTYALKLFMSADGGQTWASPWRGEEGDKIWLDTYTVVFGADYFASHSKIRFSNHSSSSVITDATYSTRAVYLKNDSNTYFGTKTVPLNEEFVLPNMTKEVSGKTFIGWFNQDGVKATSATYSVGGISVYTARYVDNFENSLRIQPSDAGFYTKEAGSGAMTKGPETINTIASLDESKTYDRIDMLFMFNYTVTGSDQYFYFGCPYDGIDAATRAVMRIDCGTAENNLRGYYNCTSHGAGSTGTSYRNNNFKVNQNTNYIIHYFFYWENKASLTYTVGYDIVNVANGATATISRSDYQLGAEYEINNSRRTKVNLACSSGVELTLSDIF